MPVLWKWTMAVLILCLIASFVIGGYKLVTTPEFVFTPSPDAWGNLEWPGGRSN